MTLLLLVRTLLALLVAAPDESLRIEARCVNVDTAACNVGGVLTLRTLDDSSETRASMTSNVATVPVAATGQWEIELAAEHFWMPRHIVRSQTGVITIDVWKTTTLSGRFVLAEKGELPESFQVAMQSVPGTGGAGIAEGTRIDCPIGADGSWSCAVPAARVDLAIRVEGFTPQYRWDDAFQPGQPLRVGSVTLRRGASLVLWLDRATNSALKTPARARVFHMAAAGASPAAQRLAQPIAESAFNARGMAQLTALPPGLYSIEVSADGFAPQRLDGVEILAGKESTLRHPIVLELPVAVRVSVEPPHDPEGKPWRIELVRIAELTARHTRAGEGLTDDTGSVSLADQAPGRFIVNVLDSRGGRVARREITVLPHSGASIEVKLESIVASGVVTMSGKPIPATLLFGGNGDVEQIRTSANDDGQFDVTLPRAGRWNIELRNDAEGIGTAVERTVARDETIEIDVPDTEVAGWVVAPDRSRVTKANVTLLTRTGAVNERTDASGAFRFRGVPAGTATLQATDLTTGEYSRTLDVVVAIGTHTRDLELEMQTLSVLHGFVFSGGQPVAGARVIGYGFAEGPARQTRVVSEIDGSFRLRLPAAATRIVLLISSAGRTFQAFAIPPGDRAPRLELAPAGGALQLDLRKTPLSVSFNDIEIPMPDLLQWAAAHGQRLAPDGTLRIPEMAPGSYRLCTHHAAAKCDGGLLARDGTLRLALD